jgi:hypothetical protein
MRWDVDVVEGGEDKTNLSLKDITDPLLFDETF